MTYAEVLDLWSKHPEVMEDKAISGEAWEDLIGEAFIEGENMVTMRPIIAAIESHFGGSYVGARWVKA